MTAPSPRGPFTVAALSLLLLAGACKDEPKIIVKANGRTAVQTGTDGAVVESADDGSSLAAPTDLPVFAPAYPGARLTTRISGNGGGEGRGTLLVFETPDAVDKVSAFYDAQARGAGTKASMVVTEVDSAVRLYGGGPDGNARGAMVAISRRDEDGGSEIVITSGLPEADVDRLEKKPDEWRRAVRMPVRLQ
jgi:hypothetical protein